MSHFPFHSLHSSLSWLLANINLMPSCSVTSLSWSCFLSRDISSISKCIHCYNSNTKYSLSIPSPKLHLTLRVDGLDGGGDAGGHPAPGDGHQHQVQVGDLLQQLQADGSLTNQRRVRAQRSTNPSSPGPPSRCSCHTGGWWRRPSLPRSCPRSPSAPWAWARTSLAAGSRGAAGLSTAYVFPESIKISIISAKSPLSHLMH